MKKTKALVVSPPGGAVMPLDRAAAALDSAIELAKEENRRLKAELGRSESTVRDLHWALKEARHPTPVGLRWSCETCGASGVMKLDPDGQPQAVGQLLERQHPSNGLEVLIKPGDLSVLGVTRSPVLTVSELGNSCFILKHL